MKVLFITRGFPSEKDIMSGNYEAVQAKALVAKGMDVSLINVFERPRQYFFKDSEITHRICDGVDVYQGKCIAFRKRGIRRINNYLRKRAYRQVFKAVVKEKGMPDIIHAHIVSIASFSIFLKYEYRLPFVITEHWTKTNVSEIPEWLRHMSKAYSQADKVLCVSQALADSLMKNFHIKCLVINNMVSDQFFLSSKIERKDQSFKFIAVGAFRKNKGFDILVEAFAHGCFHDNVTLDIVGDGEERELVERLIQQHNLSNQVKLLGTKTPDEVNMLLCNSDCFVLSSRLETFAIVVIEAMAKGLPVIATRSGGPETFLHPEHGILVEKDNIVELADAMKYMTEHSKDYDSAEIRHYCYDHFSQNVIADQIVSVYNQVLNRKQN